MEQAVAINSKADALSCPFHTLPAEILLEIISSVPFTPPNLLSLRLTCTRFNDLLVRHERTIASDFRRKTDHSTPLSYFPGLSGTTYASLATIHARNQTLANVHAKWLQIVNHGPELAWLKGRWEGVHKAGLLLLYRLQDAGGYEEKVALLDSLPAASLACLLFKLVASVRILRVLGPEPIKEHWGRGDVGLRSDVELATEECLLMEGPAFFVGLLGEEDVGTEEKAVGYATTHSPANQWNILTAVCSTLEAELAAMPERQTFELEEQPKRATLISTLRRALAREAACGINAVVPKMWEVLSCTGFDRLGGENECGWMMGRIVAGQPAGTCMGMKRIF